MLRGIDARPATAQLICEGCGCTDAAACPGGCHWVSHNPPVCSACVESAGDMAVGAPEGGMFGVEYCPASETPAPHVPLFADETTCYCARCHMGLAA